ncbi:flavodoxin domain-containing protein [Enterococcus sp. LJL99]
MKKIVIYASRYGTTKSFATKIGEEKNIPVFSYKEPDLPLTAVNEIIFVGAIYTSKILGLEAFLKNKQLTVQKITILTVGLYDPKRENNQQRIEHFVKEKLKNSQLKLQGIYSLSGYLNVSQLSFPHRLLIKALYKQAQKKPVNQRTAEEIDIIHAYENTNLIDEKELEMILGKI